MSTTIPEEKATWLFTDYVKPCLAAAQVTMPAQYTSPVHEQLALQLRQQTEKKLCGMLRATCGAIILARCLRVLVQKKLQWHDIPKEDLAMSTKKRLAENVCRKAKRLETLAKLLVLWTACKFLHDCVWCWFFCWRKRKVRFQTNFSNLYYSWPK